MKTDLKYLVGAYYPINPVEFVLTFVEQSNRSFVCDGSKGIIEESSSSYEIYEVAEAAGIFILPEKFKVENFNTACVALRDSLNNLLKELNAPIDLESLISKTRNGDCTFMFGEEYEIAGKIQECSELLINESERRLRERISLKVLEPRERTTLSFAGDCLFSSKANLYKDLFLKYNDLQKQRRILEDVHNVVTGFGLERTKVLFPFVKEELFPFVSSFGEYFDLVVKKQRELGI